MKKNLIFITFLLSASILQADPIQDLENAIKEGNHTKVLELSSNLAVSKEEFNRLKQLAIGYHQAQKKDLMELTGVKVHLIAFGGAVGAFLSSIGICSIYECIKQKQYEVAAFLGLTFEPMVIAGTIGSLIFLTKIANKAIDEAAKIVSIIKALKIKNEQVGIGAQDDK